MTHRARCPRRHSRGLGVIAALVVLVLLAGLSAAVLRLAHSEQTGATQALLATRARLAAGSGVDWGLFQALQGGWSACNHATQTLDLSAETGLWVTVSCDQSAYNEGETAPGVPAVVRLYRIGAVACNSPAGCPDDSRAMQPGYVEREREAVVAQ
jgi:MSHA biogenesis protein MshP